MTDTAPSPRTGVAHRFVGVPFRAQTYKSLAYLALGFPVDLVSFVLVTTGVAAGTGLALTVADSLAESVALAAVGVPLTLVALHALNALARAFGLLTASLLGVGRSARASEPVGD